MNHNILLQGITSDSHCDAVERVLTISNLKSATISVAYMRASGLALIRSHLEAIAGQTTLVAGVRNGVTTAQAFELGLELGCRLYAFDTGSRNVVYHPKIYMSRNNELSRVLIGSANLTYGGLVENVEASVELDLDHSEQSQYQHASRIQRELDSLATTYPKHVTRIIDEQAIATLFDNGKLLDERTVVVSTPLTGSHSHEAADVDCIRLDVKRRPRHKSSPYRSTLNSRPSTSTAAPGPVTGKSGTRWSDVWQSNPLTRRALTIPRSSNTNPTGSMLLGKGQLENVDHRHHFRDVVFAELDWKRDTRAGSNHMERASAEFEFIIRNVSLGTYQLDLSHDTRTGSRTYRQRNSMTSLHWGEARKHIAHEQFLGSQLLLYKSLDDARRFLIEIDN